MSNWREYNNALRNRGNIEVWISEEAINSWYETDRTYDGTGTPKVFTDLAILTCHEIRQVFKLPLRQCQGFIDSLFKAKNIDLRSPDYSRLSKRLSQLEIESPQYKKTDV